MSTVDYKKRLLEWAARNKHSVSIKTHTDTFPPVDPEHPRRITCIKCSAVNLCIQCNAEPGETREQCEQKAALRFLQTYGRSPLTK